MNYPRIYSLSTVGIFKHYIHDYLFHPLRTDFIGPNGVGKSIIADLLQLMFVYDRETIQFGTDGVNPRTLEKLPYKTSIAYCFLNVEVVKDKFLLIGTALNAQKGVRIIPFVITTSPNLDARLNELTIAPRDILMAKDFLKEDLIPDPDKLARELFDNKGLYISFFRTRDKVKQYYQFLYEKQVLSINLSLDSNFEAFSKVIQSFSKAKTLNLSPANASKSLKNFLFEDSDEEILQDYRNQQGALQKILREYERLNKDIGILTQKQDLLLEIKALEVKYKKSFKQYKNTELSGAWFTLEEARRVEGMQQQTLAEEKNEERRLEEKANKLHNLEELINKAYQKAIDIYDLHNEYEKLSLLYEKVDKEITDLLVLDRPIIGNEWSKGLPLMDMATRDAALIRQLIKFARVYLMRYGSMVGLEEAREVQWNDIVSLEYELKEQKNKGEKLISMLEDNNIDGTIPWMIRNLSSLTTEQRNALLYFSDIPITKPGPATAGMKYLNPDELVKGWSVESDNSNDGFWIRLGAIKEFIPFNPNASLLAEAEGREQSVKILVEKIRAELKKASAKIEELTKVRNGLPYNWQILDREYDHSIVLRPDIEKLKEAIGCIIHLDEKIMLLKNEKAQLVEQLSEIRVKIPVNIWAEEPQVLKRELSRLRNLHSGRKTRFTRYSADLLGALRQVQGRIPILTSGLLQATQQVLHVQREFDKLNSLYYEQFLENLFDYEVFRGLGSQEMKDKYTADFNEYIRKYTIAIRQFEETSKGTNVGVNLEVSSGSYAFDPLEEALLGTRIKTTDDIANALHDANQARLSMAEEIKSNMVRVFDATLGRYKKFKETVQKMNNFFKGKKISDQFFFKIEFAESKTLKIEFVEEIGEKMRRSASRGELAFDRPVDEFIQEFFRKVAQLTEHIRIDKLLSPNTYFELSVSLTDENDNEISGSTGETYSAIALLGIARLSIAQSEKENRKGLRFIILEELGSLDNTNFNTFPSIAKEFDYQIITMAPRPYMTGLSAEWYAHHLIKGNVEEGINFHPSASYFQTKDHSMDLQTYLTRKNNELDRNKGVA